MMCTQEWRLRTQSAKVQLCIQCATFGDLISATNAGSDLNPNDMRHHPLGPEGRRGPEGSARIKVSY